MHIFERMVVCMTKYTRVYRFKSLVISLTNRQHFKSNKERMININWFIIKYTLNQKFARKKFLQKFCLSEIFLIFC